MRNGFVVHHNGPQAHVVGRSHSRCIEFISGVRNWHINGNGWSDEAYSFYVCHHDKIMEGRGWNRSQWANGSDERGSDDGSDSEWYSVLVCVGGGSATGYDTGEPEEPVMPGHVSALKRLIAEGRDTGRCGDRVLPHNRFKRKPCPGQTLTDLAAELDRQPLTATPPKPPTQEDDPLSALSDDEQRRLLARTDAIYEWLVNPNPQRDGKPKGRTEDGKPVADLYRWGEETVVKVRDGT